MQGERFRVIDAFSRIVRLGEGMASSGRLSDEAMARALEALAICAGKMASHELAGKRLIATEACRRAENGEAFLDRVHTETGLRLEVVDRQTEARLAAEGCGSLMDHRAEGAVLFDIGGGSSELVLINRPKGHNRSRDGRISSHIAAWTSLPTGVVTLSERHGGHHVTPAIFEDMVADVLEQLADFEGRGRLADIWHPARTHLLGTSGTVTTIAGVHLKLPRYDRRKVDGIWLTDGQIDSVIDMLVSMDYEARARNPCIGKERADLVLAGCAILQAIRLTWPSPRLRVADRGLREGILTELMHSAGEWRKWGGHGRRPTKPGHATRPPHPVDSP
jgi:exopolyphosphatase/guanosine-5'-triphosphate,3'-diphosphate pyrophosphatase